MKEAKLVRKLQIYYVIKLFVEVMKLLLKHLVNVQRDSWCVFKREVSYTAARKSADGKGLFTFTRQLRC
jgi:hypothetical protein